MQKMFLSELIVKMTLLSDILGYFGSFFLTLRFVPIVIDYYNTQYFPFNSYLVLLEFSGDMLLGASGILIGSKPMIITNGICLTITVSLYLHSRYNIHQWFTGKKRPLINTEYESIL